MNITILDLDTIGNDLDLSPLRDQGQCTVYPASTPEQVLQRLKDAQVVILNKTRVTAQVLDAAPSLKLICVSATGFDNVDIRACRKRGIAVCNVPGYSTQSVAMVTVATVLSLMTHLPSYTDFVRSGEYTAAGLPNRLTPAFHDLQGKTWGIVGYGSIGRQVAAVAKSFGCRVLYTKNTPDGDSCDLPKLCRESDIISLHCPLNDSTRGMIGSRELSLMKPGAVLVNVARGAVCDEAAVAAALLEKKLGAFGCDVYSTEPFGADHPFTRIKDLENVCLTPHIAWASFEARTRLMEEMAANIRSFRAGENRNRVD